MFEQPSEQSPRQEDLVDKLPNLSVPDFASVISENNSLIAAQVSESVATVASVIELAKDTSWFCNEVGHQLHTRNLFGQAANCYELALLSELRKNGQTPAARIYAESFITTMGEFMLTIQNTEDEYLYQQTLDWFLRNKLTSFITADQCAVDEGNHPTRHTEVRDILLRLLLLAEG